MENSINSSIDTRHNEEEIFLNKLKSNTEIRRSFLDKFLAICDPNDLMYLCSKIDEYKRDFLSLLPIEIVEMILSYLDWKTLLNCCQVSSSWNQKLSKNFNKFWFNLCVKFLPLNDIDELTYINDPNVVNYKEMFVDIIRMSNKLDDGKLFRTWNFGPAEIEALASYKNILATATHIVKFWKLEQLNYLESNKSKDNWICFKTLQLQSRASSLKFNDKYLVASTYFLTVDLYSLTTDQCLNQYMGHTCSITCFDFNQNLMLIATGSADNTIKYWSMNIDNNETGKTINRYLIKNEPNMIWPVKIIIENYDNENSYLIIALCANGFLFLNYVEKIDDFVPDNMQDLNLIKKNQFETFNFKYKIKFSNTFKNILNLQNIYTDIPYDEEFLDEYSESLIISNKSWVQFNKDLLTVFVVTDNNSNQTKKVFIKQWTINKNLEYDMFEFLSIPIYDTSEENDFFEILNKRSLKSLGINQFEIVSFGINYCLFLDDSNKFYLANLKNKSIKCIQDDLNLDNKTNKVFRLMSNNTQEQFIFNDKNWLNGFKLNSNKNNLVNDETSYAFAFYTQKRNEVFVIGWDITDP